MLNAADRPNDIEALKALLLARDEQILGLEAQLNTIWARIAFPHFQMTNLRG